MPEVKQRISDGLKARQEQLLRTAYLAAARTDAGYRQYSERDVSILRFIRQSRRLGFSIAQIAGLLGLWSDRRRASR